LFAQQFVRGTISDERNVAIPFAKVFVKNSTEQRTVSDENGKYELSVMPGEYFLVFGKRGVNEPGSTSEEFFSFNFGLVISPSSFDRWFRKRKLD